MSNQIVLYSIAGGFSLLIGIILLFGYYVIHKNNDRLAYDEQLAELLQKDDEDNLDNLKITLKYRWDSYWGKFFKEIGWYKYSDNNKKAGNLVVALLLVISLGLDLLFRNYFIGPISAIAIIWLTTQSFKLKATKKENQIKKQLPGFLAAFKSNIQGREMADRAFIKVIDQMPSPLYEDLVIVKQKTLAGSKFNDALEELSQKTSSRDLQFLVACIMQSESSGPNLEDQITKIQESLAQKQKIANLRQEAERKAKGSIYVASITIPALFFGVYFLNPESRDFWFKVPLSWGAIGVCLVLWFFGIWKANQFVKDIKKLE